MYRRLPEDIKNLQLELENLTLTVKTFEPCPKNAENGIPVPEESCKSALQQCFNTVNGLGRGIQRDVENFADNASNVWGRLRAVRRKSYLQKHLECLGRAQSQLQIAQNNLTGWVC